MSVNRYELGREAYARGFDRACIIERVKSVVSFSFTEEQIAVAARDGIHGFRRAAYMRGYLDGRDHSSCD